MHYEEETLIRSPFVMSLDDEEEDKEISEGAPLGDDVIDELDDDGLDDGMSWEDADSLDDDEEEEIEEEF